MAQLTRGAVDAMHKGQQIPSPLVQVIDVKKILGPNGQATTPERYRLVISDGEHFQQAMLATQLNELVKVDGRADRKLLPKCVIKLNEYICNTVHGRRIVIVLNVDVMGPPLSHTIGNPQNIEGGAADASAGAAPAAAPVTSAPSRPMPQQQQQSRSGFGGGRPSAPAPSLPEGVIPIKGLHPYQSRWTIKARITARTDLKTFNGARGPGSLFSVDLLDAMGGEIRCTFFGEAAEQWNDTVQVGQVYLIGRGSVKFANKRYSTLKNEYEISLDRNAQVEQVADDGSIPAHKFSFVDIADLKEQPKDAFIDVIGVLLNVSNLEDFVSKTSGNALKKRLVRIGDASNAQVEVTLWGDQAAQFNGDRGTVVMMKGVKVSDFNDRSLTVLRTTKMEFEPSGLPEADRVRSWYETLGQGDVPSVSTNSEFRNRPRGDGAGGEKRNWDESRRTFAEIKKMAVGAHTTYFNVRATITEIKHSREHPPWYEACPKEGCNKKVTAVGGAYHCAKCSATYDNYNPRYILNINANDHSGSSWLTCFNDTAPHILNGTQAEHLLRMLANGDMAGYEDVFQKALFNTYTLRVRASESEYDGDMRLKLSVVSVTPLNYAHESSLLINSIHKLLV